MLEESEPESLAHLSLLCLSLSRHSTFESQREEGEGAKKPIRLGSLT